MTRRRAANGHRASFAVIGALLTGVLLLVVTQLAPQQKTGVNEAPPLPALETLLPSGADPSSARTLELIASADSAYVIAYRRTEWELLLVSWDRRGGAWRSSAPVPLSSGDGEYGPETALEALTIGASMPLVSARGNVNAYADTISLFSRGSGGLDPLRLTEADGTVRPARFLSGGSVMRSASFDVADVDGDGVSEAVTESVDRSVIPQFIDVRVYSWRDGGLVYDAALSGIMTLSRRTFPEPEDGEDAVLQSERVNESR